MTNQLYIVRDLLSIVALYVNKKNLFNTLQVNHDFYKMINRFNKVIKPINMNALTIIGEYVDYDGCMAMRYANKLYFKASGQCVLGGQYMTNFVYFVLKKNMAKQSMQKQYIISSLTYCDCPPQAVVGTFKSD
jgi:hypothetical protein